MRTIDKLRVFNQSMSKRSTINQCSSVARRWILRQIDINQELINQLADLVDLDTVNPQDGMTVETQTMENPDARGTGSDGSGNSSIGRNLHDRRASSKGWPNIHVRPF